MTDHAQRPHARFGASSAYRWFACPGSVRLCADVPDRPSPAALEGTRAHELLEALLKLHQTQRPGDEVFRAQIDPLRQLARTLWEAAPQDMRDAVHVAVDHVAEIMADYPDAVLLVEHRFEIPVASASGEVFGTNDVCIFVPSLWLLHVIDYKHGAGVHVDVRGNKQLRFYALGALASAYTFCEACGGTGGPAGNGYDCDCDGGHRKFDIDTVCMTIVQPRCHGEPVRDEVVPVEEVLAFGREIGEAIGRCKAPDAPLVPGEEQCRFCPARVSCPAREQQVLDATGGAFGDVVQVDPTGLAVPRGMASERLAGILRVAGGIRDWLAALEEEAERRLRDGEVVPGFKLVEAQARRQWNSDDVEAVAEELAIIKRCHADGAPDAAAWEFKVEKLRGLGEVEAILKAGCDRKEARRRLDAMAYLTTKKSSGALKVVPEDDARPAAALGSAFDGVMQVEDKR